MFNGKIKVTIGAIVTAMVAAMTGEGPGGHWWPHTPAPARLTVTWRVW